MFLKLLVLRASHLGQYLCSRSGYECALSSRFQDRNNEYFADVTLVPFSTRAVQDCIMELSVHNHHHIPPLALQQSGGVEPLHLSNQTDDVRQVVPSLMAVMKWLLEQHLTVVVSC